MKEGPYEAIDIHLDVACEEVGAPHVQADRNYCGGDAGHSVAARHVHGIQEEIAGSIQFQEAGRLSGVGDFVHDRLWARLFDRQIDLRYARDCAPSVRRISASVIRLSV